MNKDIEYCKLSNKIGEDIKIWEKHRNKDLIDLYIDLEMKEHFFNEYKVLLGVEITSKSIRNVIFVGDNDKYAWKVYSLAKYIKGIKQEIHIKVNTKGVNIAIYIQALNYEIIDELILERQHYNDIRNAKYYKKGVITTEKLLKQFRNVKDKTKLRLQCRIGEKYINNDNELLAYIEYAMSLGIKNVIFILDIENNIQRCGLMRESRNQYKYKECKIMFMKLREDYVLFN